MKQIVIGLMFTLLITPLHVAFSYEIETHEQMSEAALDASILTTDPSVLPDLGLELLDKDKQDKEQKFFNPTLKISSSIRKFLSHCK